MRNAKLFKVSLVIFCCLFVGLGLFALWPNTGTTQPRPRVTVVGNMLELPTDIKADLPTGYSSRLEMDDIGDVTLDPEDPVVVFLIDPALPTLNIKEQLEYAERVGKTEIYFLIAPVDPDVKKLPISLDWDSTVAALQGIDLESLTKGIYGFFSPTEAYAHSTPGPNCGGTYVLPNQCTYQSLNDDDASDGKTPRFALCTTTYTCLSHVQTVLDHLRWNVALNPFTSCSHSTNGCPWVDCMKAHNGSPFIKAPVDYIVKLYPDSNSIKNFFGCNVSGEVCGCSFVGTLTNPRRSISKQTALSSTMSCGWISTIKHELAHTYGYNAGSDGHQDYSNNRDNITHCQNNHHFN